MKKIAIASGKGGTGKTLVASNIAAVLEEMGEEVSYLDCDVEEPNGHLFLKPDITDTKEITIRSPMEVDPERCINCGKCGEACSYNAIAVLKDQVLFFPELCHVCGACTIVCPTDAIVEGEKKIGELIEGKRGDMAVNYALLQTGEGGMSPRLINRVKDSAGEGINMIDSPPGTACPAVESVIDMDLVVLVTDPTPFGLNDLKLAVDMVRKIGTEPVVLVNRAEYRDDKLMEYCEKEALDIIGEIPDDREIAEIYSEGGLVVERSDEYNRMFKELASKLLEAAGEEREPKETEVKEYQGELIRSKKKEIDTSGIKKPNEIVVISGKGGTGKTSITASFAALSDDKIMADCDVDAADMHLLTSPEIKETSLFSGGYSAKIDPDKCTACGRCFEECRFEAVKKHGDIFRIEEMACEGCGVCDIVCDYGAVDIEDAVNGELFLSDTRLGPMAHAKLGIAEENTGRLVTLVREKAVEINEREGGLYSGIIIDGAPGTGCPVIASITGADYALIVTEPTVSGIHDMERVLDVVEHFGVESGIIVNKYDLNEKMTEKIIDIAEEHDIEVLGKVPYDDSVTAAQMERKTVVEYTDNETTREIKSIWDKLKDNV